MFALAWAAVCSPLAAQQAAQPVSQGNPATVTSGQHIQGVIGSPYTADLVTVTTQTLADGTKITHKQLVKVFQDSQGRTRREYFDPGVEVVGPDDLPRAVRINAGAVVYTLRPRDRTAQREEVSRNPPSLSRTPGASANAAPARPAVPQPTREELGTQVIEGLEARGERITRIIPEGAEGNDQPMRNISEYWWSVKPRLLLLSVTNDPRYGETVTRLTNLVLDEPSPDLFEVPPDYTLQELQPVTKPAETDE
jgi:hypothetical protein